MMIHCRCTTIKVHHCSKAININFAALQWQWLNASICEKFLRATEVILEGQERYGWGDYIPKGIEKRSQVLRS
jgi:hypothetical protein